MQITINEYQMRINSNKTKILVFTRKPTFNTNINLGNHVIVQVSSFKCLCNLITADERSSQEIKQRTGQAESFYQEKEDSRKINKEIKKTFVKTFIWSVALYCCETWVMNEMEKKSLEAFEMWCWRQM